MARLVAVRPILPSVPCSADPITVAVENWPTERVLLWLECLGLEEHKLNFSRAQISGRMLLNMDPSSLLQLGVTKEPEQWRILQSVHDMNSLDSRYANADRIASTYDPRPFPPLQKLVAREVTRDTQLETGIFLLEDDEDSSFSSNSSGSPHLMNAHSSPANMHYDITTSTVFRRHSGVLPRSASSGAEADLPTSAPLTGSGVTGYECAFRCMMPSGVTRVVRGNSAEGWAGFQHRVRDELKLPKANFTYVDRAQSVVAVNDESTFRTFLATNGTRAPGLPVTYRLVLGL